MPWNAIFTFASGQTRAHSSSPARAHRRPRQSTPSSDALREPEDAELNGSERLGKHPADGNLDPVLARRFRPEGHFEHALLDRLEPKHAAQAVSLAAQEER